MGVYAQGPITDPKDLGPAIRRAIEVGVVAKHGRARDVEDAR